MPLINRKFKDAVGIVKNVDSKKTKIQKITSFLFPDLQETTDATVLVEFIKIQLSILGRGRERERESKEVLISWDWVAEF